MKILKKNPTFVYLLLFSVVLLSINQFFQLIIVNYSNTYMNPALALGNTMTILTLSKVIILPLSGYLVDKYTESKIIKWSSVGFLIFFIVVLVENMNIFKYRNGVNMLYLYAIVSGLLLGLIQPSLQSIIPKIILENRTKANSLFQVSSQISQFIAPTIAATLFTLLTKNYYLLILIILSLICLFLSTKIQVKNKIKDREKVDDNTEKNGMKELFRNKKVITLLVLTAVINFCTSGPLQVGLPLYLAEFSNNNASLFGYILSIYSFGSFIGSMLSMKIGKKFEALNYLLYLVIMFGVTWALSVARRSLIIILVLFFLSGVLMGLINVIFMTLLQKFTPSSTLGRATSVQFLFSSLLAPLSFFLVGKYTLILNPVLVFRITGVILILTGGIGLWSNRKQEY